MSVDLSVHSMGQKDLNGTSSVIEPHAKRWEARATPRAARVIHIEIRESFRYSCTASYPLQQLLLYIDHIPQLRGSLPCQS